MKRFLLIALVLAWCKAGPVFAQEISSQADFPDATTTTGFYFLGRTGTGVSEQTQELPATVLMSDIPGGTDSVAGPASATAGNLPSFSGTTGKLVEDSGYAPADFLQTAGTDNVKDTHIDWGSGAGQVDADDLSDGSTNAVPTLTQETNWDTAYGWGDHGSAGYETDTHASEHESGGADSLTLTELWEPSLSTLSPESGDVFRVKVHRATTLTAVSGLVDPADTGESVVVDVKECNSNGDSCVSVLSSTITVGNTTTSGTISDASIAADAVVEVSYGTVTGTVTGIMVSLKGTQSYAQ